MESIQRFRASFAALQAEVAFKDHEVASILVADAASRAAMFGYCAAEQLTIAVPRFSVIVCTCIGLAAAISRQSAVAEEPPSREAHMKAAYVFNFVKFIEWPRALDSAIEICFVGADDVRAALAASTADKKIEARSIVVRYLTIGAASAEACNVVYFDSASGRRAAIQALGLTALTVGDADDFTREGGVIRLYMENNRLRFTVNAENAKRASLQVSSNLLKLATHVEQRAAP